MSKSQPNKRKRCSKKRYYKSKTGAEDIIIILQEKGIFRGQFQYKCRTCDGYHLGRPSKSVRGHIARVMKDA